jgi:hypothetical protein
METEAQKYDEQFVIDAFLTGVSVALSFSAARKGKPVDKYVARFGSAVLDFASHYIGGPKDLLQYITKQSKQANEIESLERMLGTGEQEGRS